MKWILNRLFVGDGRVLFLVGVFCVWGMVRFFRFIGVWETEGVCGVFRGVGRGVDSFIVEEEVSRKF